MERAAAHRRPTPPVLSFDDVWFGYQPDESVLRGFSLTVSAGECVAVMGSNGSGKSTAAKLACGLLKPQRGRVDGADAAYVAQDPEANIVGETVWDDVAIGPLHWGLAGQELDRRVDGALSAVGMSDKRTRRLTSLSGGEIQRVAVAAALASGRSLIVLDEPASHLSTKDAALFWSSLMHAFRQGMTGVLLITHDPWEARIAGRIACIVHGRVASEGPTERFMRQAALMSWLALRPDVVEGVAGLLKDAGVDLPFPAGPDRVVRSLCSQSKG